MGLRNFISTLTLGLLIVSCGSSESETSDYDVIPDNDISILPTPNFMVVSEKDEPFILNESTYLSFPEILKYEGEYLKNLIEESSTFTLPVNLEAKIKSTEIILEKVAASDDESEEWYELEISENKIVITSSYNAGIMRGIQTLRQLFVPAFHKQEERSAWHLPTLRIEDKPAFKHRGLLLDVCRHYFDKEVVLKYIDLLAYYKMNVLHFHLTEDQGWRLAIDKYPKLNEISSWRTEEDGSTYGGFYTKEELKEIVAYASERHIQVIPEIELPGHSQAALAAYPQFSCTGGPIEVANDWGVFKEIYCAGNDSTFTFLEDVLTEVMEIFPSEYIHIGGDEAPKSRWEQCPKCQKRIKDEGLQDEHELQSYFIKRIGNFLADHNRKIIGWDEILEGGLPQGATVQSWRGMQGGIDAAEQGNEVIMSPTSHCYLDYGLEAIDLEKIYSFDPIPAEIKGQDKSKLVIGGEGNMWTERVPDQDNLDSKVFPRILGLAEVLWSYPEERNFEEFYSKVQKQYPALKAFGVKYGQEVIPATISIDGTYAGIRIILEKKLEDLELKYRWSSKDEYITYEGPIPLEKDGVLSVQAFKNGEKYGDPIENKFRHHKALGAKVTYSTTPHEWYKGNGESNLVDGYIGWKSFKEKAWQGFWGEDVEVQLELEQEVEANIVSCNFWQYANSWIFLPRFVSVDYSIDKEKWINFGIWKSEEIDLGSVNKCELVRIFRENPVKMKYLRLRAKNIGKIPEPHDAAGSEAWVFIDEIMID